MQTTGINQNKVLKNGSSPQENNIIGAKSHLLDERNNSSVRGLGSDAEEKSTEVWSTTDEEESAKLDMSQEEIIRDEYQDGAIREVYHEDTVRDVHQNYAVRDVYQEDAVRDVHQDEKVSLIL